MVMNLIHRPLLVIYNRLIIILYIIDFFKFSKKDYSALSKFRFKILILAILFISIINIIEIRDIEILFI